MASEEIDTKKEIGNLPISVSEQFAAREAALRESEKLLQRIPSVQIDVVIPAVSNTEALLNSTPTIQPKATFSPPADFETRFGRNFTYLPIPSIGTPDRINALIEKISHVSNYQNNGGEQILGCLKRTQEITRIFIEIKNSTGNNKKG